MLHPVVFECFMILTLPKVLALHRISPFHLPTKRRNRIIKCLIERCYLLIPDGEMISVFAVLKIIFTK